MSQVMNVRSVVVVVVVCVLAGIVSAVAGAQTPVVPAAAPATTVTAVGSATVKPAPKVRTSNASIAAAVRAAEKAAIPRAIADARARAVLLAAAGHLQLGALVAIADAAPSPFYGLAYGQDGTFGPGKYCGQVARYRTTHLPNGTTKRTKIGSRRTCRIPTQVSASEAVTYATTP